MGDPYFDLANLSRHQAFTDADDEQLLITYGGDAGPRPLARLKLLKAMSDFREAMWGVLQQGLSQLAFD